MLSYNPCIPSFMEYATLFRFSLASCMDEGCTNRSYTPCMTSQNVQCSISRCTWVTCRNIHLYAVPSRQSNSIITRILLISGLSPPNFCNMNLLVVADSHSSKSINLDDPSYFFGSLRSPLNEGL